MDESLRRLQRRVEAEGADLSDELQRYLRALERLGGLGESRFATANIAYYLAQPDEFFIETGNYLDIQRAMIISSGDISHYVYDLQDARFLITLELDLIEELTRLLPTSHPVLREDMDNILTLIRDAREDGFDYLFLDLSDVRLSYADFHGPQRPEDPGEEICERPDCYEPGDRDPTYSLCELHRQEQARIVAGYCDLCAVEDHEICSSDLDCPCCQDTVEQQLQARYYY